MRVAPWRRCWNPLEGESREAGSRCRFHWLGQDPGHPEGRPWPGVSGQGSPISVGLPPTAWPWRLPGSPPRKPALVIDPQPTSPSAWGGAPRGSCPPFLGIGLSPRVVHPGGRGVGSSGCCGGARQCPAQRWSLCPRRPREGQGLRSQSQSPVTSSGRLAPDREDPLVL